MSSVISFRKERKEKKGREERKREKRRKGGGKAVGEKTRLVADFL